MSFNVKIESFNTRLGNDVLAVEEVITFGSWYAETLNRRKYHSHDIVNNILENKNYSYENNRFSYHCISS